MRKRIWVPEAPMLNFKKYTEVEGLRNSVGVQGFFEVDLVHIRSGILARKLSFPNLIVDAGMNFLGVSNPISAVSNAALGTGSSVPNVAQTTLDSEVGRTTNKGGFADTEGTDVANGFVWSKTTRVFTGAEANGNLTEIAMLGTDMFCRQLIKDDAGVPTTIVKTPEFEVRVTYEFRVYPNFADQVYSAQVNGVAQDITVRVINWTNDDQWGASLSLFTPLNALVPRIIGDGALVAVSGVSNPTGTLYAQTSTVLDSYVEGNFFRDRTFEWNASTANHANLNMFWSYGISHQHLFTAGVSKTDTQKLVLNHRRAWERHTP